MGKRANTTRMRSIQIVFVLIVIAVGAAGDAGTDEIKIIANPSIRSSELSRDDLARIFLMTKTSAPGAEHVEPVLEKTGRANEVFLHKYIGRSETALMTYYRSLAFTGKGSLPKSFDSDSEVVAYVAKTKGAIGYVSAGTGTTGVRSLKVN